MEQEKRINQGYEIIESCTIGSKELVIGHNPKAPNPYVCWYCKGGDNYYCGCYCNELSAARESLSERYNEERSMRPITIPLPRSRKTVMTVSGNMANNSQKKYDCTTCPYPRYKDRSVIFCDVCIRKILDGQNENKQGKEKPNE